MAGLWDAAKDLIDPLKARPSKRQPAQTDPLAFLQEYAGPSSQDLYAQAMSQVGNAYDAQLENLAAQEREARNRQSSGDKQLAAMYNALAGDIGKNAGSIKSRYNEGRTATAKGTASTKSAIGKTYTDTNNELAALFSRLGIEAAAPDALAGSNSDRSFLSGLVDFSGNSAMNAMKLNEGAALDFNTAQQNIAGLTGKNRRADLLEQLNDTLGGIGQQRNTVQGQMADAVAQRQYQLEQDSASREMQLQKMMMDMYGGGSPADIRAEKAQQYQMMGPNERGRFKAASLFGEDAAPYVMQLLEGVANYQNEGVYQNLPKFIRSVIAENHKQQAAGQPALSDELLADLASYFWDQGAVGKTPPRDPNMF